MPPTDWTAVGNALAQACPSPTLRKHVADILEKVQYLGPLGEPADEFERVYTFLTYNEPARVVSVVDELMITFERANRQRPARHNAWRYVVGAHDLWLCRARVFYTAAGLVEGSLKARLDTRMQDQFGEYWPEIPDAIPSSILELRERETLNQCVATIRRFMEQWDTTASTAVQTAAEYIGSVLQTEVPARQTGAAFLRTLDFGRLRTFFQTKRLWSKGPRLESLFNDRRTNSPPLKSQVDTVMGVIHAVRNDVAHYRPSDENEVNSRFTNGLYALARLADWMNVDLQHFYGSVDSRHATELSILVEDAALLNRVAPRKRACIADQCTLGEPLTLMLKWAPTDANGLHGDNGDFGCLFHRVKHREAVHRPHGE